MHLTRYTDYGFRVLLYLGAKDSVDLVQINELVACYDIPKSHVVKVVHQLGKLGFIETVRGRGGGIRLALDPADINLGEVVRRLEPSLVPIDCFKPPCRLSPRCTLRGILDQAMSAFLQVLDQHTLFDLLQDSRALNRLLGLSERPQPSTKRRRITTKGRSKKSTAA